MLCKINRGPHFGETHHFPKSQETNALILLGDLEVVEQPVDLVEHSRRVPQHPPRGWANGYFGVERKPVIVFHDGTGGQTIYDGVPGPRRVWHYDPATETEGYVLEPSGCPDSVISEWQAQGGGTIEDREALADLNRTALARKNFEMQEQNKLVGKIS